MLNAMQSYFGVEGPAQLGPHWEDLMSVWQIQRAQTDEALLVSLALFHSRFTSPPVSATSPQELRRPDKAGQEFSAANSGRMVSRADIRSIVNGASVLVQRTGRRFDVAIEFSLPANGDESLGDRLGDALCRYAGGSAWGHDRASFIRLTERYGDSLVTKMVLSVFGYSAPESAAAREQTVRHGVVGWFASSNQEPPRLVLRADPGVGRANRFHWEEALNLCRSMNQSWQSNDGSGQPVPLHKLLGIATSRLLEPNALAIGPVLGMSSLLTPEGDIEELELGLSPLSAYDDRAWDWIRREWEVDEHVDRMELRRRRSKS